MVSSLSSKERQLKKELDDKRKIAEKIEAEIAKLIEEERKRAAGTDMTPEMTLIGNNFVQNKGRLPWPVERGVITSQFGLRDHPVLKGVKEENIGVEITSLNKTIARAVFDGQVSRVFTIKGENMGLIIRHGGFFTVYQNLVNLQVKAGDMIKIKQQLGEVFCDTDKGSKSILKFMIFEGIEERDPEMWLTKKQ